MTNRLIFLIILTINISIDSNAQVAEFRVGEIFPFSEIETMKEGKTYSIDKLDTELLVMNFWNIGCKGCLLEMPFLNKIHDTHRDESITFWSVTLNSGHSLYNYLVKHPIKWEIKGNVDFMGLSNRSSSNIVKSQFNIKCMPTTIVINKDKEILYAKCGPLMDDENGAKFVELLKTCNHWE